MKKIWNNISIKTKRNLFFTVFAFFTLLFIFRACHGPLIPEHVYHIMRSNNFAPLELFGKEPNMSAFVDELMQSIAENEHFKIKVNVSNTLSNAELFKLLDNGEYDGILATISPAEYLKNKYLISLPIYNAGPVLLVNEDSDVKSIQDIKGKTIAIKRGSSQIFKLGRETAFFVPYDNMIIALDDLDKHIIAGVILDAEIAEIYANGFYKGRIKIATAPLTDLGLRLITKKSASEEILINKFNEGLKQTEANGSFEDLIHRWNLANP
jgi:polar amino acid transport system substrate-binding protein